MLTNLLDSISFLSMLIIKILFRIYCKQPFTVCPCVLYHLLQSIKSSTVCRCLFFTVRSLLCPCCPNNIFHCLFVSFLTDSLVGLLVSWSEYDLQVCPWWEKTVPVYRTLSILAPTLSKVKKSNLRIKITCPCWSVYTRKNSDKYGKRTR